MGFFIMCVVIGAIIGSLLSVRDHINNLKEQARITEEKHKEIMKEVYGQSIDSESDAEEQPVATYSSTELERERNYEKLSQEFDANKRGL